MKLSLNFLINYQSVKNKRFLMKFLIFCGINAWEALLGQTNDAAPVGLGVGVALCWCELV